MTATLTKIALSLLAQLMTETFAKKLVWRLLKMATESTENQVDDKLVADLAEAWGIDVSE
jgi:hypothetical protein